MIKRFHSNLPPATGCPITVSLFGSFQIIVAEQSESKFRTNKSRALIAYLLLAREQPVLRTSLVELLWPGYRKESALASLRQVLTDIRKIFGPLQLLETDYHSVRLRIDPTLIRCDALHFDHLLDTCEAHAHQSLLSCPVCQPHLQQAVALYRGPFLGNFPTVDSAPFQAWIESQRQHYATRLAHSSAARDSNYKAAGAPVGNLPTPLTPLLGRTTELHELIDKLQHPVYRCLTLVGPGGIGKTRLALALGAQQAATFPDGVWFVDLAALAPAAPVNLALNVAVNEEETATLTQLHHRLATAILSTLGVALQGATPPVTQLLTYMQDKALLLILDNFEHLDAGADLLAQLLQKVSTLRLLVTTRHRPALQGQLLYQVPGLAWPNAKAVATLSSHELVAHYASIQLFLERAALTQREVTVDVPTLTAIVDICQAVEGSPLALELAAALLETHTPPRVAQMVRTNYHTLQSIYQDLPPRQRSAQAVLHTAWQLLTAAEAQTLARCAVFQGDFTAAAAQTIAGATPATLEALVHKSLLHQTVTDPNAVSDHGAALDASALRYRMHMLVQQFAADQLAKQTTLTQATYNHHAAYYLALAGSWQPTAAAESRFRLAMQADIENVESAWAWVLAGNQLTQLTPAVEGLIEFYEMIGAFYAAETILQHSIAAVRPQLARASETRACANDGTEGAAPSASEEQLQTLLATLLAQLGYVYSVGLGQAQQARLVVTEALAIAEALNNVKLIVRSYHGLAAITYGESQFAQSQTLGQKALQLARQANLRREEIMCMSAIGLIVSGLQNYTESLHYLQTALALAEATDDLRKGMLVRSQLGITYRDMGDFGEALHCFEHNLMLTQQNNDAYTIAVNSANLGFLQLLLGSYSAAASNLEKGYQRFRNLGEKRLMIDCLAVLGYLHLQQGAYPASAMNCQRVLDLPETGISALQVTWLTLGDLRAAQGDWAAAQAAYTQLVALSQQSNEIGIRLLGQCGVASIWLAQQNVAGALATLEELLPHFDPTRFDTFFSAQRFLLTAYEILVANADPRATGILQQAGQIVQEVAAKISDSRLRESYLTNVAINRRICALLTQPA